jgi:uncharacterized membrane protein YgaE (UPF0421/DUF939 family)
MAKKNLLMRLRVLSRPTGKPQWTQAVRSLVLMVLAGVISFYLGLDKGIQVIMITTLIATIIMDISLPLRKIIPLTLLGFIMSILAYTSASLGLSSIPLFILFTVLWSFFAMSTYIFGESVGFFGFVIFTVYFIAVIMVNDKSTVMEWISYCVLSFTVASLLLFPHLWNRKKELRQMVAVGFVPETPLKTVLTTRRALSGIPLDFHYYELFRLGSYITGFRGYSKQLLKRLSGEYQEKFKDYLETADRASSQIAKAIKNKSNQVDIQDLNKVLSSQDVDKNYKNDDISAFIDVALKIGDLISKSAEIIKKPLSGDKKKIISSHTSIKDVLTANFNLKNMYIRHALRFTLAMTMGLLLVHLTHDRDVIWVTMGILIIIKPDITSTVNNMIMRVFFNMLAIILAIILGLIFPHEILLALAFVMLFFFRAFLPTYMGLSVMALTIFVVFIWPTGTVFDNAIARLVDITLGALIAFICAYIVLPSRITVDLPGQLALTIQANQEYLENVLVEPESYDHMTVMGCLNNYLLEESNLDAAIKKLEDFFTDLDEDIIQYHEFLAANRKLSADISALAAFMEKETVNISDISLNKEQLITVMHNIDKIIDEGLKPSKTYFDKYFTDYDNLFVLNNFKQYLEWVISDIELLQELTLKAAEDGLFKKYRDLS